MSSASLQKRLLWFRALVLWATGALALIGFILALACHWDYYCVPRLERPFHEGHAVLRSSGKMGLTCGVWASALFVLNLGYLIRKRLVNVKFLGPLRMWMDAHVLTGLIGAGLIAFHSAMALSSVMGSLALFALAITVITGIVGRTIYIRVPRSVEGREIELKQVQDELDDFRVQLQLLGVESDWLHRSKPQARGHRTSLASCFFAMVIGDHQRRQEYRRLKLQVLDSPKLKPSARKILPLAKNFCIHWQWLIRYHELRNLISSWRFFHRWLAVLMLCVVVCHIFVAIRFGDLSFFGGGR